MSKEISCPALGCLRSFGRNSTQRRKEEEIWVVVCVHGIPFVFAERLTRVRDGGSKLQVFKLKPDTGLRAGSLNFRLRRKKAYNGLYPSIDCREVTREARWMRDHEIKEALRLSIQDGALSRMEREEIRSWLGEASVDGNKRALYQSMAFDLANEAIASRALPHFSALNWLEKVVKLLTPLSLPNPVADVTEALFTPEHNCAGRIVDLFKSARAGVDVCVFTITDDRISDAIIMAHHRGVKVRIVTDNDKCFDPGSDIDRLRDAGIPIRVDQSENHMHHKFAIFDGAILLSGSYNWTRSASQWNEENLLLTSEKRLVEPFRELFERLWRAFE